MFSTIKAWFFRVEHDVEALIEGFTNTITKLEAAAEAKLVEAGRHMAESIRFEALADDAHMVAEKATKVAGQIKALVS